jgi:hypothetical protein
MDIIGYWDIVRYWGIDGIGILLDIGLITQYRNIQ